MNKTMSRKERYDQFLKIGTKLHDQLGIKGVTGAAIAKEAGVSSPYVFQHFGDRDAIRAHVATFVKSGKVGTVKPLPTVVKKPKVAAKKTTVAKVVKKPAPAKVVKKPAPAKKLKDKEAPAVKPVKVAKAAKPVKVSAKFNPPAAPAGAE